MIIATLLFFMGMCCAYLFFGKILTWIVLEITESPKLEKLKENIAFYSFIGFISIVMFSGSFYVILGFLNQ